MTPTTKGALLIGALTLAGTILQLIIKHRQMIELKKEDALRADRMAEIERERQERIARQSRQEAEREAEREQKEKLFEALQAQNARTLAILETELKVTQETTKQSFVLLEKNTAATTELARGIALTNERISALERGTGCRAKS